MVNYNVTIYASKSNRKNAKTVCKTFSVWPFDNGYKQLFDNHFEVKQWIDRMKIDYPVFHVVAYMDNVCISNWEQSYLSAYQAETKTIAIMNLFNCAVKNS